MAKQARYRNLHNLGMGTSATVNHQKWNSSRLITTSLITSGGDTIANMKKEAKTDYGLYWPGPPRGFPDLFSTRIIKWDNRYSLKIEERRTASRSFGGWGRDLIYRMRPFTRSMDWYTDDPYEGVVEYDHIPVEDIDFSAVPHRREVLIWRLELLTSFDLSEQVRESDSNIDTINSSKVATHWVSSGEKLEFEAGTLRKLAPITHYLRESDSSNFHLTIASYDVREDGWYRQLRKTDGSFVRVPEYPLALFSLEKDVIPTGPTGPR